jgi:Polyketide cyclase / dehydrase and lipid transport
MPEQRDDKNGLADALPTDALKEAGQQLLGLLVQRATDAAAQRVSGLADRLTDVTTSGGDVRAAMPGGRKQSDEADGEDDDEQGDKPGVLARAWSSVTEKVKGAFGGGGGGGGSKKLKMTNIVESIDIGLPLRTTYNLWTQFEDFPSFMKKVETVEQAADEKTNWTAKVFWSRRTWEATTVEQVADSHIVWRSTGAKGHVDGAVTFTALGPNSTRVLLVMEYWPKGLFEHTGNMWRAQGRRARLEFKHFRRHAMTSAILHQEEIEGWRGEIRDSEVVTTHEDALEAEQAATETSEGDESATQDETDEDAYGPDDAVAEEDTEDVDDLDDEDTAAAEDDEFYDDEEYSDAEEPGAEDADDYEADDHPDETAARTPARSGSRG